MSSITNIVDVSNSGYPSNQTNNDNGNTKPVSAFYYLAQSMDCTLQSALKSFDSQSLEEREKQAILQQLEAINDLERKKQVLKFLIKSYGESGNSNLVTWLTSLQNQVENTIKDIWKMFKEAFAKADKTASWVPKLTNGLIDDILKINSDIFKGHSADTNYGHGLLSRILKDDAREKEFGSWGGFALFLGDAEARDNLSKQRLQLLSEIQKILSNPDELASNLDQLGSDFQALGNLIQTEQKDAPLAKVMQETSKPMKWWKKNVTDSIEKPFKETYGANPKWYDYISFPGAALLLTDIIPAALSIPALFGIAPQATIFKDSMKVVNIGMTDLKTALLSDMVVQNGFEIDVNTVSSLIQKDTQKRSDYNDLIENQLTGDSKLISNVNYHNKV